MKNPTSVDKTWAPYLKAGEELEAEFLALLKVLYPLAYKISGNYKQADFAVPEVPDLFVELKRDLKSDQTQNFAFEYGFRGEKSGLACTKAQLWVMADSRFYYCFDTKKLKDFFRLNWEYLYKTRGGDNNDSDLIVIDKKTVANNNWCCRIARDGSQMVWLRNFIRQYG